MSRRLTQENKVRHATSVKNLMVVQNVIQGAWPKDIYPVSRIGTHRTVGGAAFIMSDPSLVGKLVFFNSNSEIDKIFLEYQIGKNMGKIGVGPKVFAIALVQFTGSLPTNLLNKKEPGNSGFLILMENLAYGAQRLETLQEYIQRTGEYPMRQVNALMIKMQKAGIMHGDLHAGNIMVKKVKGRNPRVYFIDFGSSRKMSNIHVVRESKTYPGYFYTTTGNLIGNNLRITHRNYKMYMNKSPNRKPKGKVSPITSIPKGIFSVSENFLRY